MLITYYSSFRDFTTVCYSIRQMIQPISRYLLDTNIVLQIVRGHSLVADLEARFALFTGRNCLLIFLVTLAEIRMKKAHNEETTFSLPGV